VPFWTAWKAASAEHARTERKRCAKDIALAASFVRSLETNDSEVNLKLQRLASHLERLADEVGTSSSAKAA
jgi:hypothetical protein